MFENREDVDKVSPLYEIAEDLKGKGKFVIISSIITFLVSLFISGLIYQVFRNLGQKRGAKLGLFNSFGYGFSKTFILTLILFLLFMFIQFRVYRILRKNYDRNYKDNYLKSKKETYGGSHFQTKEELEENFDIYGDISDTTDEIFGTDDDKNIYAFTYPNGMNKNEAFFGAAGSGKTSSTVKTKIYQNLLKGRSMVVTDTKGDLYAQTSAVARKYGYKVKALMLKPSLFKNSDGFNMFDNIKENDPELDSKADVIANIIIKNTSSERESENYWGLNEFNYYKCVIMYVATDPAMIRAGKNNLPGVFEFMATHNAKAMQGVFLNIPKESPIRHCYDIFANCSEQNQGQIINGASIRLGKLNNKYLKHVLSNSEIDMTAPMKKKCLYYVVISDTDDSYKFVSALFFSTTFNAMCDYSDSLTMEEKKNQLEVEFICDEYANSGGIIGLPIKIATLRSRKIGITLILQDKGQLETMYSEQETSTILNNCAIKGLLSTNDLATAEYFSDLMGQMTVLVENLRYYEDAADVIHAHSTIQKTLGEGNRPLMYPADLMNGKLSRDELIYVISGMPPVKLQKYFAEKRIDGKNVAIHPLEKEAWELGEKKCNRHRPRWRKRLEEAEAAAKEKAEQMYTKQSGYVSPATTTAPPPKSNIHTAEENPQKAVNKYTKQSKSAMMFSEVQDEPEEKNEPTLDIF